ncbi:MAG: DUF3108 domain-containing protein [Burkholderiales bacterium]
MMHIGKVGLKTFFATAVLLAALTGHAAPGDIALTYELSYKGFSVGETRESFKRNGNGYKLESVSQARGIWSAFFPEKISFFSSGTVADNGLRPTRFEQRRSKHSDKNRTALFDWNAKSIEMQFDGKSDKAELQPGSQDALSIIYHFMFAPLKEGASTVFMTNGKKLEAYEFRKVEETRLDTPAGSFNTIHVARVSQPGETRTDVWLAKDKNFLPVRVVVVEPEGDKTERVLSSLSIE